mmetsp:Transcript_10620/g.25208  ORF Transcript_10620/g.25208 Transcript_10620/m.25208 type:complete len:511 (-) Transcript_10620:184-1716(-)
MEVKYKGQFHKTAMCRFFQQNRCAKGDQCTHAHDPRELQVPPDLTKTSMCKTLMQTGYCGNGDKCKFAHGAHDLRSTHGFFKTGLCYFHFNHANGCTQGRECRYAHSVIELRKAPNTDEPLPTVPLKPRSQVKREKGGKEAPPSPARQQRWPGGYPPHGYPPPGGYPGMDWGEGGQPSVMPMSPDMYSAMASLFTRYDYGNAPPGAPQQHVVSNHPRTSAAPGGPVAGMGVGSPSGRKLNRQGPSAADPVLSPKKDKAPGPPHENEELAEEIKAYLRRHEGHCASMAAVGGVFHVRKAFVQRHCRVIDRMVYLDEAAVALATAKGTLGELPGTSKATQVGSGKKKAVEFHPDTEPKAVDVAAWLRMMGLEGMPSAGGAASDGSSSDAARTMPTAVGPSDDSAQDVAWTVKSSMQFSEGKAGYVPEVKNTFINFKREDEEEESGDTKGQMMKRTALSVPTDLFKLNQLGQTNQSEGSSPNMSRSSSFAFEPVPEELDEELSDSPKADKSSG